MIGGSRYSNAKVHALCRQAVLAALLSLLATGPVAAKTPDGVLDTVVDKVKADYANFYSGDSLLKLGIAFGVGGVLANTDADQEIRDWYQDDVRSSSTDDVADVARQFGKGEYVIAVSLAAVGLGAVLPEDGAGTAIGRWGGNTARAFLVGAPAMRLMQHVTGGSRPGEREDASHWRPFDDSNGVSGHSFYGSVPFLTLAQMSDTPAARYSFYFLSALPAWSRINDDRHFASQAFLGWFMGWQAVRAVTTTEAKPGTLRVSVLPWTDGAVLCLAGRWR